MLKYGQYPLKWQQFGPNGLGLGLGTNAASSEGRVDFFVSAVGNDDNAGTAAFPWLTIAKVNAEARPGDHIFFRGGDTFSGTLVCVGGFSEGRPTIYESYGTGKAIISGGLSGGISALNCSYLELNNLEVAGAGTATNTAHGVDIAVTVAERQAGIVVTDLLVHGFGRNGLNVDGRSTTFGFDGVTITDCVVHDCTGNWTPGAGSAGIMAASTVSGYGLGNKSATHTDVTISGCEVYDCNGTPGDTNWNGSGIFIGETDGGLIVHCYAHDCGANGSAGPVAIWVADAINCTIRDCHAKNMHTNTGIDGGGFDIDGGCQNCTIEDCYSEECDGPGYLLYAYEEPPLLLPFINNTVRWSISRNDGEGGFHIRNDESNPLTFKGIRVYNNTIIVNNSAMIGVHIDGSVSGMTGFFANNIVMAVTNGVLIDAVTANGFSIESNLWYTTGTVSMKWNTTNYATVALWQAASAKEIRYSSMQYYNVDPKLTDPSGTDAEDLVPLSNSPIYGQGMDIELEFGIEIGERDYAGNTLRASKRYFDLGAFEMQTAPTNAMASPDSLPPTTDADWFINNITVEDGFTGVDGGATAQKMVPFASATPLVCGPYQTDTVLTSPRKTRWGGFFKASGYNALAGNTWENDADERGAFTFDVNTGIKGNSTSYGNGALQRLQKRREGFFKWSVEYEKANGTVEGLEIEVIPAVNDPDFQVAGDGVSSVTHDGFFVYQFAA